MRSQRAQALKSYLPRARRGKPFSLASLLNQRLEVMTSLKNSVRKSSETTSRFRVLFFIHPRGRESRNELPSAFRSGAVGMFIDLLQISDDITQLLRPIEELALFPLQLQDCSFEPTPPPLLIQPCGSHSCDERPEPQILTCRSHSFSARSASSRSFQIGRASCRER